MYALPSGRLIRRFTTGEPGERALVNDATVAPNGDVYATDSQRGLLFRVPAKTLEKRKSAFQPLAPFVDLSNTPVGLYANGLVTAGKRYMLVVGTVSGALVRVDLKTKAVRQVDLHGASLPVGDGLARDGRTLYAVNSISRVTQLKLSKNWLSATRPAPDHEPQVQVPDHSGDRRQATARGQRPAQPARAQSVAAVHGLGREAAVGLSAGAGGGARTARRTGRAGAARCRRCRRSGTKSERVAAVRLDADPAHLPGVPRDVPGRVVQGLCRAVGPKTRSMTGPMSIAEVDRAVGARLEQLDRRRS